MAPGFALKYRLNLQAAYDLAYDLKRAERPIGNRLKAVSAHELT